MFYGDEAFRNINDRTVITYTLVGNNKNNIEDIFEKVYAVKKSLLPSVDPASWKIHMKEMYNNRKKHSLFKNLTKEDIIEFSNNLSTVLANSGKGFIIYNISIIYKPPKKLKNIKNAFKQMQNDCYVMLLLNVINDATMKGIIPHIFFDKTQRDGWAKDAFWGSMQTLVYSFVTRGICVPEPKHIDPASHLYLELADFVSFVIARFIDKKLNNKTAEINPALMGNIVYLGFNLNGNLVRKYSNEYPWEYFFKTK